MRAKLREYYDSDGGTDPVRIELVKGTYVARFEPRYGDGRETPSSRARESGLYPQPVEDKPSLAVLPFANMSNDGEQEYFADGITDILITELSRLPGLFVISRHSSFVYKNASKRAEEIAAELGVRYLLEGSVQRAAQRARITAQLIDASSGAHLWAERYDRDLKDFFAVQDDVTRCIVAVLKVKLSGTEGGGRGYSGTANVAAQDSLWRGLERYWSYTQKTTEEALVHFERAIELDPGYAFGHAWVARALIFQWTQNWESHPEILEKAFEHACAAVDLDEHLAYAYAVMCWVQIWRQQGDAALAAGRKAIQLDPNHADAYLFLSFALVSANHYAEGVRYIKQGMRLNPHPSAFYQLVLGLCYVGLDDLDLAADTFKLGTELSAPFIPNHVWLCAAYKALGREEEARVEHDRVLKITKGVIPPSLIWLDKRIRPLFREAGLA